MPYFLSREDIYRLIQRELPEGTYPDGPPSAFYSTADSDSSADIAATAYGNLERIYENQFPQTADERIDDWVLKAFGFLFDDSVTLQEKRDRVVAKLRKKPTIRLWEVLTIVASYLPEGKFAQVAEYGCGSASGWYLDDSGLGISTFLGAGRWQDITTDPSSWCETVVGLGWRIGENRLDEDTFLSQVEYSDLIGAQMEAYGYEIRIFDHAVTGVDYEQMLREVKAAEPARSFRFVKQNQVLEDYGLTGFVPDVGEFDLVDCITRNSSAETGYDGRIS